ncbi:MAG: Acetyltransferase [Candidatus Celerinatantimonas neptuna]|nr:MAG: Acetyltransferase [Candidatus Celerinatantimonas neptuna]
MRFVKSQVRFLEELASWPENIDQVQLFAGPGLSWPLSVENLRESESSGQAFMLVDQEFLLGYCQLKSRGHGNVRLCRVIVNPRFRGKGLGQQLVCFAMQFANTYLLAGRMELSVYQHNTAAILCYQKLGFMIYQHRKVQSPQGQLWKVLDMQKILG